MRVNEDTVLRGQRVILVPYEPHHVVRYHEWMKSEELQKLTASEPLTLEQEYDMQRSWREDNDKCTFIILDAERWDQGCPEEQCMVGDVNLFISDPENPTLAEIEIMIAEPTCRGKGFGEESTRLMLFYGISYLGISTFQAKIGQDNMRSVQLFNKLHFEEGEMNKYGFQWNQAEVYRRVGINEYIPWIDLSPDDALLGETRRYLLAQYSRSSLCSGKYQIKKGSSFWPILQ